jgi:hypothetical protein
MPPMTKIYQGPMYIDIIEENLTPPDSIPLVSTYIYEYDNRYMEGYQSSKAEASVDQKVGPVALILTGFYSESTDIPRSIKDPITIYRYSWTDYPNEDSRTPIDTIYTDNDSGNSFFNPVGYSRKWGAEFQFITKRLESISTVFRVDGAFYKSWSGADGTYMSTPRQNEALGRTIYPIYNYTEGWRQRMIVNYRADWLIKRIGMWVTFHVQQTLFNKWQSVVDPVTYSSGYYDPLLEETVYITPQESADLGLDRVYDENDLKTRSTPNDRLLFNINISKSLGRGAEVSMFVHNFFDDQAYYLDEFGSYRSRNHDIFYGLEFSVMLDNLFRKGGE